MTRFKMEICHVCKKEKKPYTVIMNSDTMSIIQHLTAREPGPICERCNQYHALTNEFKEPTDEELENAKWAAKFARMVLLWWEKDSEMKVPEMFEPEPEENKREWPGTYDLAKWAREHLNKTNKKKEVKTTEFEYDYDGEEEDDLLYPSHDVEGY